ncbi:MAG TPA: hypothetical protein VKF38_01155 [Anaerolineaceae bacterium]|nr:hypothetical protein [Anaerolineaceae bacterium]
MATSDRTETKSTGGPNFSIVGQVKLESQESLPGDISLSAYAFDGRGALLGSSGLDAKGGFTIHLHAKEPPALELVIGPTDDPKTVRLSSSFSQSFSPKDWVKQENRFVLRPDFFIPIIIWWPWRPIRVCVTGHVRKINNSGDGSEICPVPFVKVEVFDVDREGCFWPPILNWWDKLLDQRVVRVPDLLAAQPIPLPGPGPVERFNPASVLERVALNPQPLPPKELELTRASLSSQFLSPSVLSSETSRVGEVASLPVDVASRLDQLTLTSKVAPWLIFPRCFYSKQLVCETTTDCDGFFRCCFTWYPWHIRHGRLRFDPRPDIIVRLTQVINGIETVIYMDPYTSTRWNVTNANIDLWLDNEEVECGSGCQPQPVGTSTFFTLIGLDEVYKIDQLTGLFSNVPYGGGLSNVAYGDWLLVCGLFGSALSTGAPKRYYRLSTKKGVNSFKPITYPLSDTRVDSSLNTEIYALGPQTVNGVQNLYEVRDTTHYSWYNLDKIGWWDSASDEPDTGFYTIRLEVFNENGVKLTSASVDYLNGAVPPPGPLPPMVDSCDLNILIDNQPPIVDLEIPAAAGACGVVPWSMAPGLTFDVNVNQIHNRLYYWSLRYEKGLTGSEVYLASASSGSGLAVPIVNFPISGAPLLVGLTGTCAFSLTLDAYPLVRNGFGFINYRYQTKSIAVEKCS